MRIYALGDEARIDLQAQMRRWGRAGLLQPSQVAALDADLRVDLRRTGRALRVGLALFTALIIGASLLWVVTSFRIRGDWALTATSGVAGLACLAAAELLAGHFRLYRHGVEEMLYAACVLLLCAAAMAMPLLHDEGRVVCALTIGAGGGLLVYRRLGLVVAAIAGMACAASIPFQLHMSPTWQRTLAAATLAAVFGAVRAMRARDADEVAAREYALLQAAAWAGIYLMLNLQIAGLPGLAGLGAPARDGFYWCTFAMVWILPIVGLRLGILAKDRPLIDVSLAMALATCVTSKPYLGWSRQSWDPIVMGVLLTGGAIALRRWLSCGPNGERAGFTPVRLLESNRDLERLIGAVSLGVQPHGSAPAAAPPSDFGGGRSGGAGGGAGF